MEEGGSLLRDLLEESSGAEKIFSKLRLLLEYNKYYVLGTHSL
jgi:hypothetical protein